MTEILGVPCGQDLPEGWVPTEVIAIVKCLRPEDSIPEGQSPYGLVPLVSGGLTTWEAEGILNWAARRVVDIEDEALMGNDEESEN